MKMRITTTIESETTVFDKRKARMSGHHIKVTRDTTVSDEPFETEVETEPGVFVHPATLEGYNVSYKTTKTVVTVQSNVTEEEVEESSETRTKKFESIVTESEIPVFDTVADSQQEIPVEFLPESSAIDMMAPPDDDQIISTEIQPVEESPAFSMDEDLAASLMAESAPESVMEMSSTAQQIEASSPVQEMDGSAPVQQATASSPVQQMDASSPVSPVETSSPSIADGTQSESAGSMDDLERTRRSKKPRRASRGSKGPKGMKLPGILSCTRKRSGTHSSSSEEDDPRPKSLQRAPEPKVDEVKNAAINAKLQEIAITISWISTRRVSVLFVIFSFFVVYVRSYLYRYCFHIAMSLLSHFKVLQ